MTDLTGYRVHWGTASRSYSQSTPVNGAANTQHQVTLGAGTWYFAVTAIAGGVESAYSGEVSKTVN
ncbi:MAG: hypothetical protein HC809_11070 [Gammaproteobacteria bacterium]|nr:hypothetical protein [Gammaproteobacteria bacterium]